MGITAPRPRRMMRLLRFHRSGMLLLAASAGAVSGAGAVLFRLGIDSWTSLLTGAQDYTAALGPSRGILSWAGRWFVLLAPVLSGLAVGPLMTRLGATSTGHGVGGAIWAARRGDGAMSPRPAVATTMAAALTIGGGGSVGPEGPIAELGASTASVFGRRLGLPARSVRILAAGGTAAGIAAAFNAPLAGAFFAMEVILLDFTADAFAFVVVSCVSATVVSHHLLGTTLSVTLPPLGLGSDAQLGWVAVLGVLGGAIGVGFSRCRFLAADAAARVWARGRVPAWCRPGVGGVLVGAMLVVVPQTYGESTAVLGRILDGRYPVLVLLALVVAKTVATATTLAVGFAGGVFAPSLFVGGALGAAFGALAAPGHPEAAAVYGVLGMGAVFAGAARAPMTGVVLIIEMTGQYDLLVPVMLAVVLATLVSRFLTRTTIYTEELRRRGEDIDDPLRASLVGPATALTLMKDPPGILYEDMDLREAAEALRSSGSSVLPVVRRGSRGSDGARAGAAVDAAGEGAAGPGPRVLGELLGSASAVSVAEARLAPSSARHLADVPLTDTWVAAGEGAAGVLEVLSTTHAVGLPVVTLGPGGVRLLVGWVDENDMVRRLYRHQRAAAEASRIRTSLGARVQAAWRRRGRAAHRPR